MLETICRLAKCCRETSTPFVQISFKNCFWIDSFVYTLGILRVLREEGENSYWMYPALNAKGNLLRFGKISVRSDLWSSILHQHPMAYLYVISDDVMMWFIFLAPLVWRYVKRKTPIIKYWHWETGAGSPLLHSSLGEYRLFYCFPI